MTGHPGLRFEPLRRLACYYRLSVGSVVDWWDGLSVMPYNGSWFRQPRFLTHI